MVLSQYFRQYRHCSSPAGVQDSSVVVEEAGGQLENFTAVSWQIGLGDTLCYRCCYSPDTRAFNEISRNQENLFYLVQVQRP